MSFQSVGTQKLGDAPSAYDKSFFDNSFGKINRMFAAISGSNVVKSGSTITVSIKSVSSGGTVSVQISLNGSPVGSPISLSPGSDLSLILG